MNAPSAVRPRVALMALMCKRWCRPNFEETRLLASTCSLTSPLQSQLKLIKLDQA